MSEFFWLRNGHLKFPPSRQRKTSIWRAKPHTITLYRQAYGLF